MNCRVAAFAVLSLLAGCSSRRAVENSAVARSEAVETVLLKAEEVETVDGVVHEKRTEWELSPPDTLGRQYVSRVTEVNRKRARKTEKGGSVESECRTESSEHRERTSVQTVEAESRPVFRHVALLAIAAAIFLLTLKISRK